MNKKRIKSEEGYLSITKIGVRKWAVDVTFGASMQEPFSVFEYVLSSAALLDAKDISITVASVMHSGWGDEDEGAH